MSKPQTAKAARQALANAANVENDAHFAAGVMAAGSDELRRQSRASLAVLCQCRARVETRKALSAYARAVRRDAKGAGLR